MLERIINGRAEMEEVAKELRRGEEETYLIKFAKTGMFYRIDREKLEAYLGGGNDRKFYEEVGATCEPLRNPYFKGDVEVVADEVDELDDLGESEQAPEAVEEVSEEVPTVEEPAVEAEPVVEEAIVEPSEVEETKPCECEAKIAELEATLAEKEAQHLEFEKRVDEVHQGLTVEKERLEEELSTVKNDLESQLAENGRLLAIIGENETKIAELTAQLEAPVEMTMISLEKMVYEIAHRGYEVELKYSRK